MLFPWTKQVYYEIYARLVECQSKREVISNFDWSLGCSEQDLVCLLLVETAHVTKLSSGCFELVSTRSWKYMLTINGLLYRMSPLVYSSLYQFIRVWWLIFAWTAWSTQVILYQPIWCCVNWTLKRIFEPEYMDFQLKMQWLMLLEKCLALCPFCPRQTETYGQ